MRTRKILLVDDDIELLDALSILFESMDCDVRTTTSGKEALTILKNESYKVIFLDINMPEMNGIDLCKKIREKYLDVYIIACSGSGELFESEELNSIGFNDCLNKPMSLSILRKAVDIALKSFDS